MIFNICISIRKRKAWLLQNPPDANHHFEYLKFVTKRFASMAKQGRHPGANWQSIWLTKQRCYMSTPMPITAYATAFWTS